MSAAEQADSPLRRRSLLLPLLFTLIIAMILFLGRGRKGTTSTQKNTETEATSPPPPSDESSATEPVSASPPPPEVTRHTIRGDFHLAPGEVAILSFWNREPGRNTLVAIEPETLPDGNVMVAIREISLTDRGIETADAGDLFPGWLEDDHIGTTSRERLEEFLQLTKWQGDLTVASQPRVVTAPGREAEIHSAIRHPDWPEEIWSGQRMRLTANPSPTDGGFDLGLVFEKQEQREN